ncbi:universal stress protein [Streptomyces sp. NBC_00154]|uniref:universal stress protein n=1 Tax=Streptomyces sp. NBC_00154 TaxID=2975670 RepID=UPI002256CE4F|nr:universal stress protein [Streptomyces sp. NBC_00154]MCX5317880.1 universal stress protein [Streptomyces sp. NBC_00154]
MAEPVVVGVDGSPSSLGAVGTAAHEAALRGTGLRLVNAFGWPSMHPPPGVPPWTPATAGLRELVDGTLAQAEQRAREVAPHLDITREVTLGEPLTVLEIESRTASLVVVGSRGLGAFGGLLLGSTAVHLAAHGHSPVLVVRGRPGGPNPTGPVLLAVDGSPAGEKAIEFAFTEAAMRGAGLLALHVWNTWSERAYEGPGDPLNVVVDIERLRAEEQQLLEEILSPWQIRYPQVAVERRLVRSRIRTALIDASHDAQLVVAGARGRGGFTGLLLGSVSQALLHHAHCSVAVVRGKA